MYQVEFETVYNQITEILSGQAIDNHIILPQTNFPTDKNDIVSCPLCKTPISQNPAQLPLRVREARWKPEWINNKRGEGEDGSLQIMHVEPLAENQIKHNAQNVRFGHRWCNVAMTDHSVEETLDFMQFIVTAHNRT